MGASIGKKTGAIADINVTPLIDVVLVLLVVFMVITPLLQSGMPVDLPKATTATTVNDVGQFIVVSIGADCSAPDECTTKGWWVEQDKVDEDSLIDQINYEYRLNPERVVLIKADGRLPYKDVRAAMDVISSSGMTSMLVAVEKD